MCSFEGTEGYIKKKKRTDDVLFFFAYQENSLKLSW